MYLADVADCFLIPIRDGLVQVAPYALQPVGKGQRIKVVSVSNDLWRQPVEYLT